MALLAAIATPACGGLGQPSEGTLVLLLSGPSPTRMSGAVRIHSNRGWESFGHYDGRVPAAPQTAQAGSGSVADGRYDAVSIGSQKVGIHFSVGGDKVEPVLLGVLNDRLVAQQTYAGDGAVNLGLAELGGKFPRLAPVELTDQAGRPFSLASADTTPALVATFSTTDRASSLVYAGLFLQLEHKLPSTTRLIEVSTDPAHDTPMEMQAYAHHLGADWTLLTGPTSTISAFWAGLAVQTGSGLQPIAKLALVDSHGFVVRQFDGTPDLHGQLPPALEAELSAAGRADLGSGGNRWDVAQVLDAVHQLGGLAHAAGGVGQMAPSFTVQGWDGRSYSSASLLGRSAVLNFWASWCVPCRTEMPLLQAEATKNPAIAFLFINEKDDTSSARSFVSSLHIQAPIASDPDGSVGARFGVVGLPTTVFVRPDGSIETTWIGQLGKATLDDHLASLGAAS